MKKIGKNGKANIEARKRIAEIAEEKGLNHCEIGLTGCTGGLFLAPAHHKKRAFYKANVDALSDYKNWVCACVSCHQKIEVDEKLTRELFIKLRGNYE